MQLMLALRERLGRAGLGRAAERRARAGAHARGGVPRARDAHRAGRRGRGPARRRPAGAPVLVRRAGREAAAAVPARRRLRRRRPRHARRAVPHALPPRGRRRALGRVPQGARAPVPGLRRGRAHRLPLGGRALRARRRRRRQRGRQPRGDARDRVRPRARAADLPGRRRHPGAPLARAVRQGLLPHRRADAVVHGPLPAGGPGPRRPAALAAALTAAGASRRRRSWSPPASTRCATRARPTRRRCARRASTVPAAPLPRALPRLHQLHRAPALLLATRSSKSQG